MPRRHEYESRSPPRRLDAVPGSRRPLPLRPLPSPPVPLEYIPPSRPRRHKIGIRDDVGEDEDEDEFLSAEAATRVMLEKWDLLDATSDERSRLPTRRRRQSRVREWEQWEPERERIRLAQVEMERRLEEEAKAHQLASMQAESAQSGEPPEGSTQRKSTPWYSRLDDEARDRMAECRSTPASAVESIETRPRSRRAQRSEPVRVESTGRSISSTQARRPGMTPTPDSFDVHDDPDVGSKACRAVSAPLPPRASPRRSRSARRKPRPVSPAAGRRPSTPPSPPSPSPPPFPSPPPSPSPPRPPRRSQYSRRHHRRRRPPSPPAVEPTESRAEPNLLVSTATHAAEQVSEVVSTALNRVLPGFFGGGGGEK